MLQRIQRIRCTKPTFEERRMMMIMKEYIQIYKNIYENPPLRRGGYTDDICLCSATATQLGWAENIKGSVWETFQLSFQKRFLWLSFFTY